MENFFPKHYAQVDGIYPSDRCACFLTREALIFLNEAINIEERCKVLSVY
jgi:hypothetical protein